MEAIVLDTETTGLSPESDRVTEVAVVDLDSGEVIINTLINPGRPIPGDIQLITKIIDEMVQYAPPFSEIAPGLAQVIRGADALIAHNPWFDQRMLAAEFQRCDIVIEKWPTLVCTKRIWDIYEPRESRHLTNAYKRFVDKRGFNGAHGALPDVQACARVLKAQLAEFELHGKSWAELDPERSKWWGPSEHVVINEDGILIFNVGKHKGTACHMIDNGFWGWLISKDFPQHVIDMANHIILQRPSGGELASWAYGKNS